jgi:hypothetical protein
MNSVMTFLAQHGQPTRIGKLDTAERDRIEMMDVEGRRSAAASFAPCLRSGDHVRAELQPVAAPSSLMRLASPPPNGKPGAAVGAAESPGSHVS